LSFEFLNVVFIFKIVYKRVTGCQKQPQIIVELVYASKHVERQQIITTINLSAFE